MNDYILLMHDDLSGERRLGDDDWTTYLAKLRQVGAFQGGSSIGDGVRVSRSSATVAITRGISGYIRIRAESLDAARELVVGNPTYEAGGTVEIRELPKTG